MVAVGLTFVVGDTAGAEVPVPSVTMPLRVTPPGVAAFWANAGKAAAIEISAAQRTAPTMVVTQPVSCPARQPLRGSTFGGGEIAAGSSQPKTNEETAAQMAHQSPSDSSAMTMNAGPRHAGGRPGHRFTGLPSGVGAVDEDVLGHRAPLVKIEPGRLCNGSP